MHDSQIQEFPLGTGGWNSHPVIWRNFVTWVIHTHLAQGAPHHVVMECVTIELLNRNLTLTDRTVHGTWEDLTAWQLAYG